uniref:HAT C-terminal dimerisation domain-containing protein n=1 Tax=Cajanus cajan TaxID=3821 RepID=A0A151R9F1_CAJCA|nr:hypothetical protein KK1_039536 [Cajanus cajan]
MLTELEKFPENPRIEENEKQLSKVHKVTYNEFENSLERDPGKRPQIWQYPPNQTDEVRRAYLRGETSESRNQGNFLEMIKLIASYNDEVAKVVLENAPYNCKYTSHKIQKEILFCIIVDEARDESKKEQMALVDLMTKQWSYYLLTLSLTLVPKDAYKAFNIENICTLVGKYYPMDFSEQEKVNLHFQLQHFIVDARQDSNLKNLSTMQELCTCLALIDRLLRLIMTLPVSTATTERSFSTMKIIKIRLRNKMEADF